VPEALTAAVTRPWGSTPARGWPLYGATPTLVSLGPITFSVPSRAGQLCSRSSRRSTRHITSLEWRWAADWLVDSLKTVTPCPGVYFIRRLLPISLNSR
jgi:hypothetical protein